MEGLRRDDHGTERVNALYSERVNLAFFDFAFIRSPFGSRVVKSQKDKTRFSDLAVAPSVSDSVGRRRGGARSRPLRPERSRVRIVIRRRAAGAAGRVMVPPSHTTAHEPEAERHPKVTVTV